MSCWRSLLDACQLLRSGGQAAFCSVQLFFALAVMSEATEAVNPPAQETAQPAEAAVEIVEPR